MPALYDQYQLENSRLTRPFQGSTLNELIKVSDVFQQRYDATGAYVDALEDMTRNAKSLEQDKKLLQERTKEYKGLISEWSKRKDLENLTRDAARAAKQFGSEYGNFASNLKAASEYSENLDKLRESGKISKQRADALKEASMGLYSGMEYDKATGKYNNPFKGIDAAPEIDDAEWVRKVASDIAETQGTFTTERPAGDYFIKSGSGYKYVTKEQVAKAVAAAYQLDPNIQSDYQQREQLARYKASKYKMEDLPEDMQAELKASGKSLEDFIVGNKTVAGQYKNLLDLANKYVHHDKSGSFEYSGTTVEGQARALKLSQPDTILSLSTTTPGGGLTVKSGEDFAKLEGDVKTGHTTAMTNYSSWLKDPSAPKRVDDKGQVWLVDASGKKIKNVTDEAESYRSEIKKANNDLNNLNQIKQEAAKAAGFNLEKLGNKSTSSIRTSGTGPATFVATDANTATSVPGNPLLSDPSYKKYEEELAKRLNRNAESSSILLIQDAQIKKIWSENLTALSSDLGLKDGVLSFSYGSGKDQTLQLSASDYKNLKGDIEVVGFESSRETGETQIKLRAHTDIKGKKVAGKDLVLNLGGTDVDQWLERQVAKGNMDKATYTKFKDEAALKVMLKNTKRTSIDLDPAGKYKANVYGKDNRWHVELPTASGVPDVQIADSYGGILDIIYQASDRINPKK